MLTRGVMLLHDNTPFHMSESSFWNARLSRWTIHCTAQTWHQVILCSDVWRNICLDIIFLVTQTFRTMFYCSWSNNTQQSFYGHLSGTTRVSRY